MSILVQKHIGTLCTYCIEKDRVVIFRKNLTKREEFSIKFEDLGFDINRRKTWLVLWFIPFHLAFACLCTYAAIDEYNSGAGTQILLYIGGAFMFAGIAIYSFFENNDKVYVAGGSQNLSLEESTPSKDIVDLFITDLHDAMRSYYKEKFGAVSSVLDKYHQYHNFKWLLDIKAIDQAEYEHLIEQLKMQDLFS